MSQKETIRRILKEETRLIPVILRRVEIDKLNEEFNESLEHTSNPTILEGLKIALPICQQ